SGPRRRGMAAVARRRLVRRFADTCGRRVCGLLVLGRLLTAHGLAPLAPRLGLLALALDRRFLVVGAALHLLEQALFLHALLEGLERRFDLILDHLDSHEEPKGDTFRGRFPAF